MTLRLGIGIGILIMSLLISSLNIPTQYPFLKHHPPPPPPPLRRQFVFSSSAVGDCWFIAAAASLAIGDKKIFERCVPLDQSFEDNYAGKFSRMNTIKRVNFAYFVMNNEWANLNGADILLSNSYYILQNIYITRCA